MTRKSKILEKVDMSSEVPSYDAGVPQRQAKPAQLGLVTSIGVQRAAGNLAVQRLMQARHNSVLSGNPAELEADRMADAITQPSEPRLAMGGAAPAGNGETPANESHHEDNVHASSGTGNTLAPGTRAYMESRFGEGLGDVRLHTGGQAARSAQYLTARAYTIGQDVFFGPGQYSPETAAGKQLLAHELTHVLQQRRTSMTGLARQEGTVQSPESEAAAQDLALLAKNALLGAVYEGDDYDIRNFTAELTHLSQAKFEGVVEATLLGQLSALIPDLLKVSASVHGRQFDYVSASQFLARVLGMPAALRTAISISYGTDYFIRIIADDIGLYLSQTFMSTTVYSQSRLNDNFAALIDRWGDPYGLLELDLEGSLDALVRLRAGFYTKFDSRERMFLGAEIGRIARHVLLLSQELQPLRDTVQRGQEPAPTPQTSVLEEQVARILPNIQQMAQSEANTLKQLGDRPQLLSPQGVSVARPIGLANRAVVSPEEAFPEATDMATLGFMIELITRVDRQAEEVARLRDAVIPSQPTYTFQEFTAVYRRWFAFFSVQAREANPFYRALDDIYTSLHAILGYGGAEGGLGRHLLMLGTARYIEQALMWTPASTAFAAYVQGAQHPRRELLRGSAISPRYEYAELFERTPYPLSLAGEQASGQAVLSQQEQLTSEKFPNLLRTQQLQAGLDLPDPLW